MICGINAAIGYGVGVLATAWRAFADRDARPARPVSRRAFLVVAPVAFAASVGLGPVLAAPFRVLMGAPGPGIVTYLIGPVLAIVEAP